MAHEVAYCSKTVAYISTVENVCAMFGCAVACQACSLCSFVQCYLARQLVLTISCLFVPTVNDGNNVIACYRL